MLKDISIPKENKVTEVRQSQLKWIQSENVKLLKGFKVRIIVSDISPLFIRSVRVEELFMNQDNCS